MFLKIAFLEPHLQIFGGIRRIIELSNRLVARGHAVTIYHSDGAPCSWMECRAATKPAADILHEQHDVLIYNDPTYHDLDLAERTQAKLKVYYCLAMYDQDLMLPTLRAFILRNLLWFRWKTMRTLLTKKALLTCDLALANASWMQKWLQERLGIQSTLLLGGVNTEMFHPVTVMKDPTTIRVLYSGDARKSKGTVDIEAARKIVETRLPNVVFETYAGKGIPQSEMAQVYSSADIFVDAQTAGGWNNPVAEAMACKVPVICTEIGAVQDFAFHQKTAILVPPRDSQAIAEAILRLANDASLRHQLSENAYQQIRQFSWDESAQNLERLLEQELKHNNS